MNFITKTNYTADLEKMKLDLANLLDSYPWPQEDIFKKMPGNQIGIRHRPGATDQFLDSIGGLYDKTLQKFVAQEKDFSEFNSLTGSYTRKILEDLAEKENINLGRVRYMRMMPKTGLSVHPDFEVRYHYVFETNKYAYFGDSTVEGNVTAKCYHIPADGYFYKVDTTREHFVFNGGWEPRIHLVVCAA